MRDIKAFMSDEVHWDGGHVAVGALVTLMAFHTTLTLVRELPCMVRPGTERILPRVVGALIVSASVGVCGVWCGYVTLRSGAEVDKAYAHHPGWVIGSGGICWGGMFVALMLLSASTGWKRANSDFDSDDDEQETTPAAECLQASRRTASKIQQWAWFVSACIVAAASCLAMMFTLPLGASLSSDGTATVDYVVHGGFVSGACVCTVGSIGVWFFCVAGLALEVRTWRGWMILVASVASSALMVVAHYCSVVGLEVSVATSSASATNTMESSSLMPYSIYSAFCSAAWNCVLIRGLLELHRTGVHRVVSESQRFATLVVQGRFDEMRRVAASMVPGFHLPPQTPHAGATVRAAFPVPGASSSVPSTPTAAASPARDGKSSSSMDSCWDVTRSARWRGMFEAFAVMSSYLDRLRSFLPPSLAGGGGGSGVIVTPRGHVLDSSESEGDLDMAASGSQNASLTTSIHRAGSSLRMVASMAPLEVGLEKRDVAILALNCHGFLKVPEKEVLSKYAALCGLVGRVAKDQRGVVDSMFGDHVILSFNASTRNANYAQAVVTAAVQLQRGCEFCTAIGIATGVAGYGNVGAVGSMVRFTVHGRVVSIATRLMHCCKEHHSRGVHILSPHSTELALTARIRAVDLLSLASSDSPAPSSSNATYVVCEVTGLLKSPGGDEWMYEIEAHDHSDTYFHVNEGFLALSRGNMDAAVAAVDAASAAATTLADAAMLTSQLSNLTPGSSTGSMTPMCPHVCTPRVKVDDSLERLRLLVDRQKGIAAVLDR